MERLKFVTAFLATIAVALLAMTACSTPTTNGEKATVSTAQIVSGAEYLTASVEAIKPSIQAALDTATDMSQRNAATNLLVQVNQFETSVNTFVTVAKASSSASEVNGSYETLKSTLQGLLAAAAPYLIKAALAAAS